MFNTDLVLLVTFVSKGKTSSYLVIVLVDEIENIGVAHSVPQSLVFVYCKECKDSKQHLACWSVLDYRDERIPSIE